MYDRSPHTYGTYQSLTGILERTGGDLITIDQTAFKHVFQSDFEGRGLLELLSEQGIAITTSRVLCCLTSGLSDADGEARPEYTVHSIESLLQDFRK